MTRVAQGLSGVRERISLAARAAGRDPSSITLVAISKRHGVDAIREAYAAGQRAFGENYAQELESKRSQLADLPEIEWHFVGALQSNKAKLLVPGTALIHSVDRPSAAEALGRRAVAAGTTASTLIEVNVGGEPSKSGINEKELGDLLHTFAAIPAVAIRGLMCIPPPGADAEHSRPFFRKLRELRDEFVFEFPGLELLSMGMSRDYEIAIAEGATHVRVGSAIFGDRPAH